MVIPCELVLLLERLFALKIGKQLIMPDPRERIKIYMEALGYVQKDPRLLTYVLGHRRQVSYGTCRRIDDMILGCACLEMGIIPKDFRERLPRGSYLIPKLEFLRKMEQTFDKPRPPSELDKLRRLVLAELSKRPLRFVEMSGWPYSSAAE